MSSPIIRMMPRQNSIGPLLAAAVMMTAFYAVGLEFLQGFTLDLGSLTFPTPAYTTIGAFWMLLGGASAALLATALVRWSRSPQGRTLEAQWCAIYERQFLFWSCVAAFALPVLLRVFLLHGAPLTDDESAYRFAAELLASGRLWVHSPPMKLFYDQNFMINDGRLYPGYFLGWPALLVPGVLLHAPGLVNPLLSALTVPALYLVVRHFAGPLWGRASVLLYLSAPFVQIAAATMLAHTSELFGLAWCLYFCLQTRSRPEGVREHVGFALAFCVAFWIRPQAAMAIGLPLLLYWAIGLRGIRAGVRRRAIAGFLVPAALLATLFLVTQWRQNGSPFRTPYASFGQYISDNEFRFTTFTDQPRDAIIGFDFDGLGNATARTMAGLFRLSLDLFGWPSSFLLLFFALPGSNRRAQVVWWMIASFALIMMFQKDWGVDTFGPVHGFELVLPIVVLSVLGAATLSNALPDGPRVGASVLGALMVTAWLGFVPIRLEAVREIAAHVNLALNAPKRAGLHHAVIFAPWPFAPACDDSPKHFVLFRPVNDPDLRNDILWVNHLDVASDQKLLQTLPGRAGYVMFWTDRCTVSLVPLAGLKSGEIPDGRVRP